MLLLLFGSVVLKVLRSRNCGWSFAFSAAESHVTHIAVYCGAIGNPCQFCRFSAKSEPRVLFIWTQICACQMQHIHLLVLKFWSSCIHIKQRGVPGSARTEDPGVCCRVALRLMHDDILLLKLCVCSPSCKRHIRQPGPEAR